MTKELAMEAFGVRIKPHLDIHYPDNGCDDDNGLITFERIC